MNWAQKFWHKHDEWYWARYFYHCGNTDTYKEAWERTEKEVFERFEVTRYVDYYSFKASKQVRFGKGAKKKKEIDPKFLKPVKPSKKKDEGPNQMDLF